MTTVSDSLSLRALIGNPAVEAIEMADVRGGSALADDPAAEMDAAFGYGTEADELTEREIDRLYEEEMGRRDRERLASEGDGGAVHPLYPHFAERVKSWEGDLLVCSIDLADRGVLCPSDPALERAWLAAATAEVLCRLEAVPVAA